MFSLSITGGMPGNSLYRRPALSPGYLQGVLHLVYKGYENMVPQKMISWTNPILSIPSIRGIINQPCSSSISLTLLLTYFPTSSMLLVLLLLLFLLLGQDLESLPRVVDQILDGAVEGQRAARVVQAHHEIYKCGTHVVNFQVT